MCSKKEIHAGRPADGKQTGGKGGDWLTDRQTDRQTGKQTDRPTVRQSDIQVH